MAKLIGRNRQGFANSSVISSETIGTESISGPTSDSDFYIASDSATETQHKIIHINDNKVVAGWIDGSNYPYVAVGSVGTDGTTTWGTPSAVNGTTTSVDIDLVHLANDKFMVLYDEGGSLSGFGSDHYLYGKVGSISSTTVSSYGTAVRLDLDYNSTYRGLDRDNSHALLARKNIYSAVRVEEDKVFLAYRRSFAFARRILTVSGTTITLASHSNIMADGSRTARNIRCAVSPENGNNIVVFYAFNSQGNQVVRSQVVSGTSISQSSEKYVSQDGTGGNNRVFLGMDEDAFDICWLNSTKFAYTLRLSHPTGSDGKNSDGGGSGYASGYSEGDVVVAVFEFNGTGTIGSTGASSGVASIMATNSDSGARLARINDTKIAAIYRNDDDSNTLYYRIGTLGGSDAIVWDTAVDTNLTGSVGFKTISITKNIRSTDARAVLFVKTATALTGGHTDNAVSSTIQGSDTIVTYTDTTKFLSSVWSLKDQNKKISKGEWIRNDAADTGVNAKGRVIKGSGLEVSGHRHFQGGNVKINAIGAGGHVGSATGNGPVEHDEMFGGFTSMEINITPGTPLNVIVGGGGEKSGTGTFGGGGAVGPAYTEAGSGGGYSGVFEGPVSQGNAIAIAGGGGGGKGAGANVEGSDGAGGGLEGNSGGGNSPIPDYGRSYHGTGGTQSAGGVAAGPLSPSSPPSHQGSAGSALQGGDGAPGGEGGGGGGGYFGGGGGWRDGSFSGGGGGGSGYITPAAVGSPSTVTGGANGTLPTGLAGNSYGLVNELTPSYPLNHGAVEIIDGAGPTVYTYTGSVQTHTVT